MKALSGKPKKCAVKTCRALFVPPRPFVTWCSPDCGVLIAIEKRGRQLREEVRKQRQEIKVAKERIKTRSEHMREAQQAFNAWVRLRDAGMPCISCGSMPDDSDLITGSRIDAGHYRSTGACPELRFEPLNCHAQCVKCNRNLSGNVVEYRIRLIARIGADAVSWLEGPHEPRRYTVEELKAIKAEYRAKAREIKRRATT